jgi:hypothetical protein
MEPPHEKKGSKKISNEKKANKKFPTTRNDSGGTESAVKPQRLTENRGYRIAKQNDLITDATSATSLQL